MIAENKGIAKIQEINPSLNIEKNTKVTIQSNKEVIKKLNHPTDCL